MSDYLMVNTWIFFHTCQAGTTGETDCSTSYTAISLSLPTSLYGEGRSCKMEAADDLSVLLEYVTHGDYI